MAVYVQRRGNSLVAHEPYEKMERGSTFNVSRMVKTIESTYINDEAFGEIRFYFTFRLDYWVSDTVNSGGSGHPGSIGT